MILVETPFPVESIVDEHRKIQVLPGGCGIVVDNSDEAIACVSGYAWTDDDDPALRGIGVRLTYDNGKWLAWEWTNDGVFIGTDVNFEPTAEPLLRGECADCGGDLADPLIAMAHALGSRERRALDMCALFGVPVLGEA